MSIEWLGKCSLMISEAGISVDPVVTVSSIRTSNAFSGMRCFIFFRTSMLPVGFVHLVKVPYST